MPSPSATVDQPGVARQPGRTSAATARGVLRLMSRAFWPSVLGLVALNGWRAWENRPLADLRTVGGWVEAGRLDEAERALRDWVRRAPDSPDARMLLARVLATRDDLAGCAVQLHGVPFWAPQKNEALFREAQSWQKLDRARDAEAALRAYAKDDPNHPVARPYRDLAEVELINLLALEDRWEEARALIWRAFPRAIDVRQREELLVMSLRTYLVRHAPETAVVRLRRFIAADPGDFEARVALAAAAQTVGKPAEADAQIAACLKLRPGDPRAWRTRLEVLKTRGDLDGMRSALAEAPASAAEALWPYRGQVLAQDVDLDGAYAAFVKAIAARPNEADLHYRFALVARRLGRTAEAEAALKTHGRLRKANESLNDALTAFEKEGRPVDAAAARRSETAGRLASLCADLGWSDEAREWAKVAKTPTAQPQ